MTHFILEYDFVERFTERRAPFREAHLRLLHDAQARGLRGRVAIDRRDHQIGDFLPMLVP